MSATWPGPAEARLTPRAPELGTDEGFTASVGMDCITGFAFSNEGLETAGQLQGGLTAQSGRRCRTSGPGDTCPGVSTRLQGPSHHGGPAVFRHHVIPWPTSPSQAVRAPKRRHEAYVSRMILPGNALKT